MKQDEAKRLLKHFEVELDSHINKKIKESFSKTGKYPDLSEYEWSMLDNKDAISKVIILKNYLDFEKFTKKELDVEG